MSDKSDKFPIGPFKVEVWGDGHPVTIVIKTDKGEIRFEHKDLISLDYAVRRAMRAARLALPEKYRLEV